MRRTPHVVRVVALTSVVALAMAGCSAAVENVAEGAVERAIENELGESADVTIGEDSFSVDTEEGSITAGAGSVPEDFPSDVPLPEGEIAFAQRLDSGDGISWSLIVTTSQDPVDLTEQIRGDLDANGFTVEEASEFAGGDAAGGSILAEKDDLTVFVLVAGEGDETTATFTVTQTP